MTTSKSKVEGVTNTSAGRKKGGPKTGGRKKGTVNKNTKALKDMILGALDKKGGETYLMQQAEENPTAFLTLIGKVLPTTLAGDSDAPPTFCVKVIHE